MRSEEWWPASPRIALMSIGIKWHDSFLYSSPKCKQEMESVMFHVKHLTKVIILLISISNIEPYGPVIRLKGLWRVMRLPFSHNLL